MGRLIDKIRPQKAAQDAYGTSVRKLERLFTSWQGNHPTEYLEDDFISYVREGYKQNAVLFGIILARMSLFSEIEFKFQSLTDRHLYGTQALGLLNEPWPNGTTGELLSRMEQDVSLAGNAYVHIATPTQLQRLRPDWVTIVTDGEQPIGYFYHPDGRGYYDGGQATMDNAIFLTVDEVVHWSPIPDPQAAFRGMSWITPVVREVLADKGMTRHKQKFFEQAATPNLLIKVMEELDEESRERLRAEVNVRFEGVENAYRTMILDGGADATVIGSNMQQMSFDAVQAAGENRIAAAAGVPGIVVGLKEGLQAATYSNYQQALRRWVDVSMYPQWRSVSVALSKCIQVPGGSRLWFDATHIAALRQDESDVADILLKKAQAAEALARAGFDQTDIATVIGTNEGFENMKVASAPYFPAGPPSPSPEDVPPVQQVPGEKGVPATPQDSNPAMPAAPAKQAMPMNKPKAALNPGSKNGG